MAYGALYFIALDGGVEVHVQKHCCRETPDKADRSFQQ